MEQLEKVFRASRWRVIQSILLAFMTAASAAAKEPIKVGFIISKTGVTSPQGLEMLDGFNLFLDECQGSIDGRPLTVIVEDDESSVAVAKKKLEKLVMQDKVNLLNGIVSSTLAYACAPLVDKYKIPFVESASAADNLTQRQHYQWLVRTSYAGSQQTHPFGEWVYKDLKYKKVITFGMDFPFGWEMIGGFQHTFERAGGKVVQKIWVPLAGQDYTEYLRKLRPDADAIFFVTNGVAARLIAKQFRQMYPKLPVLSGPVSYNEMLLKHESKEALGAISVTVYSSALDSPDNKKFVENFQRKYGRMPSSTAEYGYTSGLCIAKAVRAVNGRVDDKSALMAALRATSLTDAPRGPIKLDSYGNPVENVYVTQVQETNGKLHTSVIHTFENVSQFWTFNPADYLKGHSYDRDHPPCSYCK